MREVHFEISYSYSFPGWFSRPRPLSFRLLCYGTTVVYMSFIVISSMVIAGQISCNKLSNCNGKLWLQQVFGYKKYWYPGKDYGRDVRAHVNDTVSRHIQIPSPPPSAPDIQVEIEMQPPPPIQPPPIQPPPIQPPPPPPPLVMGERILSDSANSSNTSDTSEVVAAIQCCGGILCLLIIACAVTSMIIGRAKFDAAMEDAFNGYSSFV